jgi:hypothetical protein
MTIIKVNDSNDKDIESQVKDIDKRGNPKKPMKISFDHLISTIKNRIRATYFSLAI